MILPLFPHINRVKDIAAMGSKINESLCVCLFHASLINPEPDSTCYTVEDMARLSAAFGFRNYDGRSADIYLELNNLSGKEVTGSFNRRIQPHDTVLPDTSLKHLELPQAACALFATAIDRSMLGVFEIESIIKVSKIIALLDNSENIRVEHVAEAIQYQSIPQMEKIRLREAFRCISKPNEEDIDDLL